MADVLAGERYVSGETRPNRERATQRALIVIIVLLSVVLIGEIVYHLVLAPRLLISTVDVEGDLPLTPDEIYDLAGIGIGTPYFAIDAAEAEARIESLPIVRDAQVELLFPDRISVTVQRRVALAAALAQTDSGTRALVFDDAGVVFRIGFEGAENGLPVVSGLRFASVEVGLQLPALVVDFLRELRALRVHHPGLYRLFSEYRIVQRNEYVYEVVLYPMHFALPVRIGTSIDADMVQYVMMMLDVLEREGRIDGLRELDFRSGEAVLRPRENGDG